jgi:peptide/nickel transport system substrate-binding protein
MTIDIRDIDFNTALDAINANSAEIWVMAWRVTLDPDIYQLYHSSNVLGKGTQSNLYMISDTQLDKIMEKTRTTFDTNSSKELFHAAYNIILDWGVELPVYQAKKCDIFSTKQVNIETLPKDMTTYWGWRDEIQNIELN